MGLFNRHPASDVEPDDAAATLADAVSEFDVAFLARATADQRAQQIAARTVLFQFVDAMWDDLKARGLKPANDDAYAGVAGLRDLADRMIGCAFTCTA